MERPSMIKHLRDILILPFTMTVIVPYLFYNKSQTLFANQVVYKIAGVIFFAAGVCLFIWTVCLFRTFGKGTLAPWTPTQKLIIHGPYKYCRNPMISVVLFIIIGEALFLNSSNILFFSGIFFLINTIYFILKEEPDMKKRFGKAYEDYKTNVPRWIPKLRSYKINS
ncbi:isoprenylcysteine carboxylmethyltransferase family protein [Danxiaibacter flavus]|uniref:Isoprenylcysteine carboxylmethyltransferase family protein n=1 Tax=Danxiaibacter flavus TaxID=3049108 RepID=A0ABV3ZIL7_9BACT|nr:isoprenylcysteine carboxylmethyltransferase family protein [Chitinophagaceae bacterium DXS]